ncbi:MAG: ABC transporter ATP-binding protein [Deltaproteobacteria bacterium]|jgi:lipooligosaccharide transport system ATP-binding protein|nr:ABC transporter ATP-binding protein [Deltaproteobacteria bacterium]
MTMKPEADALHDAAVLLEIRGLRKAFGERVAVSGLDFAVRKGECLGLLGPNGAGKTTTIHMLLGLVTPLSGDIYFFGVNAARRLSELKKRIGVTPQTDNLDPDLTAMENLTVYASYFGIDYKTASARAEELLDFFALKNRRNEIISAFSGGQRRRLLIARALINNPDLLILDEPTIGLDPQARRLIWDCLEMLRRNGTTMLLTSHYMEEVSRLATQVLILDGGKAVAYGVPDALVQRHVGREVYEIRGSREHLAGLRPLLASCKADFETGQDVLRIFVRETCPELDALVLEQSHVTRRPAGLEDLFLRLTGSELKEN